MILTSVIVGPYICITALTVTRVVVTCYALGGTSSASSFSAFSFFTSIKSASGSIITFCVMCARSPTLNSFSIDRYGVENCSRCSTSSTMLDAGRGADMVNGIWLSSETVG